MAPKARSSVAPAAADDEEGDEEWGDLGRVPSGFCCMAPGRTFKCCDASSRQHWRLACVVFSGGFIGIVVYLSINAYNITEASTGGGG